MAASRYRIGSRFAACLLTAACVIQAGCAVQPEPDPAPTATIRPVQIDPALELLHYTRALVAASPDKRLEMLAEARAAYERHQSPESIARLALAYGQPGHRGYAPENGARYARKALAAGEAYWSEEAAAYLRQFAILSADNVDVRHSLTAERQQGDALEAQLTRAQEKLRAITKIETRLGE